MNIYCLEDFKQEFDKLSGHKSYQTVEQDVISYFFNKSKEELCSGTRLNNSDQTPYIKKRINGRGGFRLYFLIIVKQDELYLMFIHPKTGSMGAENITNESRNYLYKKVLDSIKSNDLYCLKLNESEDKINFVKVAVTKQCADK